MQIHVIDTLDTTICYRYIYTYGQIQSTVYHVKISIHIHGVLMCFA